MDLAPTFDDVVRIAQIATDPASGWASLVVYLEKQAANSLPQLGSVDLAEDVAKVRGQIVDLLQSEPPSDDLNAVYFGLFDAADDGGKEAIGYYIAGVKGFDPKDGDSLCDLAIQRGGPMDAISRVRRWTSSRRPKSRQVQEVTPMYGRFSATRASLAPLSSSRGLRLLACFPAFGA